MEETFAQSNCPPMSSAVTPSIRILLASELPPRTKVEVTLPSSVADDGDAGDLAQGVDQGEAVLRSAGCSTETEELVWPAVPEGRSR